MRIGGARSRNLDERQHAVCPRICSKRIRAKRRGVTTPEAVRLTPGGAFTVVLGKARRCTSAEGVGGPAAVSMPVPLEKTKGGTTAEGLGGAAAGAMPLPLEETQRRSEESP